jgi:predicted O-methyltransferase YrrM
MITRNLFSVIAYLRYLINSGSRHSVHSPFVYELVDKVFRNKMDNQAYQDIAKIRRKLLLKTQVIEITDFGSGANYKQYSHRFERVSSIARNSSVTDKYGRLLYRLVGYFKPQTIIELGTSLGISTLYMALANPDASVFTVEGCTTKSEQAASNFSALLVSNVEQHIGHFDLILPDLVKQTGKLDFAFIDGNHTYEATIANFDILMSIADNDTVFVFDDIHWSADMQKAWNVIIDHERVTVSIDLFRFGLVFLKKELSKQKFVIRF